MSLFCDLEKTLNFQACLQGSKSQKSCSRGLSKNIRSRPLNYQKNNCAKTLFLQYIQYENLVLRAPTISIPFKNRCKKWPGNTPETKTSFTPSEPTKLWKCGRKIFPRSQKIWHQTPTHPSCCSHGPTRCPQGAKMMLKVLEWRYQAFQIIGFEHPE